LTSQHRWFLFIILILNPWFFISSCIEFNKGLGCFVNGGLLSMIQTLLDKLSEYLTPASDYHLFTLSHQKIVL